MVSGTIVVVGGMVVSSGTVVAALNAKQKSESSSSLFKQSGEPSHTWSQLNCGQSPAAVLQ
jgi:hypothetical protein